LYGNDGSRIESVGMPAASRGASTTKCRSTIFLYCRSVSDFFALVRQRKCGAEPELKLPSPSASWAIHSLKRSSEAVRTRTPYRTANVVIANFFMHAVPD